MPSAGNLLLGIGIMVVSCVCAASGLLLIKSSGVVEAERTFFRRPRWLIGFTLLAGVASALDMIVYNLLPLSLVAPFAGFTLILTLFLASTGLLCAAEALSRAEVGAAMIVAAGVGTTSFFGPHATENLHLSIDTLQERLGAPIMVTFIVRCRSGLDPTTSGSRHSPAPALCVAATHSPEHTCSGAPTIDTHARSRSSCRSSCCGSR